MEAKLSFATIEIPSECSLYRTETFEYRTPLGTYDIELFEQQDGQFYAIGLPRYEERVVVYGSNVVSSASLALASLIEKIERDRPSGPMDEAVEGEE